MKKILIPLSLIVTLTFIPVVIPQAIAQNAEDPSKAVPSLTNQVDNAEQAVTADAPGNTEQPGNEEMAPEEAAPQSAASPSSQYEGRMIKAIEVLGNKSISISIILSKIKTRVGQPYQENVISDDLKRLYNTSFFSDVTVDHSDYEGGLKVTVKVVEKPVVDEVSFSKIKYFGKSAIQSKLKTKKGKFLDNKSLKDDENTIIEMYQKKGLMQVTVDEETFVDDATNKASVHFIIREGYKVKVKRINIYGNTAFTDAKIIRAMKTRNAWLFNGGYLKEDVLKEDMDRIQSFYGQQGYIDAQATYAVEPLLKGEVNVNVTVEEGRRYYVGDIAIAGNSIATEQEIRASMEAIKTGNVFSREKLDTDTGNVRTMYFDKGYIFAKVDESTSLNPESGKVDIKIDITEGGVAYINKILIQGNTRTRDIVIRRELRMYPGDQFDGKKLRRSKDRLRNLGYFEDVGFDIEDTKYPDQKNLVVQVKEAKTGSFSFGGGYSTVDKLIGFVEVEQKNFDITNWPSFTGGGQDLAVRAELGSSRKNAQLSFTEPWLFDYPVSAGFDVYRRQNLKDSGIGYAYDETRTGGDLRLGKQFSEYLSGGMTYRLENVKIGNFDDNVTPDLKAEEGTNVISDLGFNITPDYRDNVFNPTKGWVWTNSFDFAGGFLGGDKDFYRFQTKVGYYIPLQKVQSLFSVLSLSVRAGVIEKYGSSDSVPIYERFFAGGARTIRGYDERKVGPLDANTGDSIGGNSMLVANIEYTLPVLEFLKVAAFFDAGNVWDTVSNFGSGSLKSGAGLGLRIKTPIGPINLDYGYPLNTPPDGSSRSGKFYFSVGQGF